jgi:pyridoxamine 5'-phosphate oxidase family protein
MVRIGGMILTENEKQYLSGDLLGRLATVGPAGAPMNHAVACWVDPDTGEVEVGGPALGASAKVRNIAADPRVSIVIDDIADEAVGPDGQRGRGLEIRGHAELVAVDRPLIDGFSSEVLRIRPRRILSWNVDGPGSRNRNV